MEFENDDNEYEEFMEEHTQEDDFLGGEDVDEEYFENELDDEDE
ncbi:MAG: hypothetical protein ACOCXG_01035 [Nanoarchaeota archaeon]